MNEEEEFYAWLDGELDAKSAARVEARMASDPALANLKIKDRKMSENLRSAFDPLLADAAHPPRFSDAQVVDLASRRTSAAKSSFGVPQWAAMAATLIVGLVAGTMLQSNESSTVKSQDGRIYAAASLNDALERQLASQPKDSETIRIGMTFRAHNGRTCRNFSGMAGQGVACHDDSGWIVEGLFASPQDDHTYRMATGDDPRINDMIDSMIVGEPFDAERETEARRNSWR